MIISLVVFQTKKKPQKYDIICKSPLLHNQNFIVRKFHPRHVINVVEHFAATIDVGIRVVFEPEFFLFQYVAVYFCLDFVFSEEFEQDFIIS